MWINHHHPWFSAQLDLFGQCIACHNEWQAVAAHSPPIPHKVWLQKESWENQRLVAGIPTHLQNISQLGWSFPIYGKVKNVPNHYNQTVYLWGTISEPDMMIHSHMFAVFRYHTSLNCMILCPTCLSWFDSFGATGLNFGRSSKESPNIS